jgi:hypothetical protein
MEYARFNSPDGSTYLVKADGSALGSADSDRKTLHILPKLLLDRTMASQLDLSKVNLTILSEHKELLVPEGGMVIRQPYPNTDYLVAGSPVSRNGWCVNAESLPAEFEVEFCWHLREMHPTIPGKDWWVRHCIQLKLLSDGHRTFTMSSSNWPQKHGDDAPLYRQPKAFARAGLVCARDWAARNLQCVEETIDCGNFKINEDVVLYGIPYEQATSIHAFQELQLHEREQVVNFSTLNDVHSANGVVSLPPEVFLEALRLAQISFQDTPKPGKFEEHPALKLLCDWWEANVPTQQDSLKAGYCMPLIRVEDDDEYWSGYGEIPNTKITAMTPFAASSAVCGGSVLLQFYASAQFSKFPAGFFESRLVTGEEWCEVSATRQDVETGVYDEAWYSLEALRSFPTGFKAAFEELIRSTAVEINDL